MCDKNNLFNKSKMGNISKMCYMGNMEYYEVI